MEALYRSGEADLKPLVEKYGTMLNISHPPKKHSVSKRRRKIGSNKKAKG
jgi:hypothetical protein